MELNRYNAFIVLNDLPNIGPITLRRLLDAFHRDPVSIFNASSSQLKSVKGVGDAIVNTLRSWQTHLDLEKQLRQMEQSGIRFVITESDEYPSLLKEIYDPLLGCIGKVNMIWTDPLSPLSAVGRLQFMVGKSHVS
ncbi:hypothetical protein N9C83_00525 [Opitutales bacterium]|nr:hypothetical protein [Opitutales bacterium]